MPWWGWLLGGCGGCAVVGVLITVALVAFGVNQFQGVMKDVGPVDTKTVKQGLGEVPIYPSMTINEMGTRVAMGVLRAAEKAAGKEPGSILKTMVVGDTQDAPEKVLKFYQQKLKAQGWVEKKQDANSGGNTEQRMFTKGNEVVMIQVQHQNGGTMVTVIRGGPGLPASQMNQ
jgi:hypothetical protein